MKSKNNIVFLGMMGSGKTSIGKLVSEKLDLDFFDIDQLIEAKQDMKISKIFENKSEEFFRILEEKISLKILKLNNVVISLGGGAFLNKRIRDEVINKHISFWLKWDDKTLVKRIKNNPKRPLAFHSTNQELVDMIKKRSNIYSKALYKIKCDNLDKFEIVEKVLKHYENH